MEEETEEKNSAPTDTPTYYATTFTYSSSSEYDYHESRPPTWGKALLIFDLALVAVTVLFVIASWIFLWKFRNNTTVAMGQPSLMAVLCLAALSMTIGILCRLLVFVSDKNVVAEEFTSIEDAERFAFDTTLNYDRLCNISEWMWCFGWLTIVSILLGKLYRVYRVTRFRRNQVIHSYHIVVPYLAFIIVFCGTVLAVELLHPNDYKFYDNNGTVSPPYRTCYHLGNKHTLILYALMMVFNFIFLLGLLILAWKLRDTQEELAESRAILFVVVGDILTWFSELFIYSVVTWVDSSKLESWDRVFLSVPLFVAFELIYVLVTLGLLLLPRMYYVWYELKHGELPPGMQAPMGAGAVHVRSTNLNSSTSAEDNQPKDHPEPVEETEHVEEVKPEEVEE